MFEITKNEAILKCLNHIISGPATRHQRGSTDKDLLLHDLEAIEKYLIYIKKMIDDPEEIYIDITGNNIINDMILSKYT